MQDEEEVKTDQSQTQSDSEQDESDEIKNPTELSSLDLAFQIAQNRYRDEEERRNTVESKLGTVATIDALVIAIAGLYSESGILFISAGTVLSAVSALIALYRIWPREYDRPAGETGNLYDVAKDDTANRKERLLLGYVDSAEENESTNQRKYTYLKVCATLTIVALVLVGVSPVANGVHRLFGIVGFTASSC